MGSVLVQISQLMGIKTQPESVKISDFLRTDKTHEWKQTPRFQNISCDFI